MVEVKRTFWKERRGKKLENLEASQFLPRKKKCVAKKRDFFLFLGERDNCC